MACSTETLRDCDCSSMLGQCECPPHAMRGVRVPPIETVVQGTGEPAPAFDPVQRPEHYTSGAIECIDAIAAAMSVEAFRGFLRGNALKYLWRYERKGGVEDLNKAQFYLDRLVQSCAPASA